MGGSEKTVVQTIIKRKIRIPEEPQENAGWKVAYADFVTAMMAFFMVMWLLSSVNEDQRRGIAGYFRPSSDLNRAETGSLSMVDKGILHGGDTLDAAREAKLESLEAQSSSADEQHQNAAQKDLKAIKTLFSDLYKEKLGRPLSEAQIGLHLSDEGFQFDFFETKGAELFDTSQNPKTALIKLLDIIAKMTAHIEYPLAVEARCITQIHLQVDASEHIKLKLEPVTDKSIRIEMHMNLNATIERLQRRRDDLKRFFLNQGYQTVEITLTHTPEAKTPISQSRHRMQAVLAEDLSTKPQALTATAALPFGPNAAQHLTLSR